MPLESEYTRATIKNEIFVDVIETAWTSRAAAAWHHKTDTAEELVGSFAVTCGAAALVKAVPAAREIVAVAGVAMLGLDLAGRVGVPLYEAATGEKSMRDSKHEIASNIGSALFDYPLIGLTGALGHKLGTGRMVPKSQFGFRGETPATAANPALLEDIRNAAKQGFIPGQLMSKHR